MISSVCAAGQRTEGGRGGGGVGDAVAGRQTAVTLRLARLLVVPVDAARGPRVVQCPQPAGGDPA